jgi:hypothetical protein|tara:strand:- start:142 stop:327 length:186 start_codon:yes stop_codon:yes gene_type:complete
MILQFVKSQKTDEYVVISEGDMDFNTPFASTLADMKEEKARIDRALLLYADDLRRYTKEIV